MNQLPARMICLVVGVLAACRDRGDHTQPDPSAPSTPRPLASAPRRPGALPPLAAESWLVTLPVPVARPALVSVPLGATDPRPVVIGMHGAGDRPEWACGGYRGALDAFPFIICPAGRPSGGGKLDTGLPREIAEDVDQATAALRARFGPHVAEGPLVYAGFSLGAIRAPAVLQGCGRQLPRVLLIEGAHREFTPDLARRYAESGGERVLFLCAARACPAAFNASQGALRRAGIQTRVVAADTLRHNLDGEMVPVIHGAWPWLVEGLPAWKAFR